MAIEHASAPDDWRRPRVDNTRLIARAWSEFGNYRSGGHIYTGYKRIARLCKRDESTVKRVTKDLEASGWLRQVYAGHGAMHRAAIWQLTIPDHGQLSTQSSGPKRSVTPVTDPPTTCLSSSPSGAGRDQQARYAAWSGAEDERLSEAVGARNNAPYSGARGAWAAELASQLGRTPGAIRSRMRKLGLVLDMLDSEPTPEPAADRVTEADPPAPAREIDGMPAPRTVSDLNPAPDHVCKIVTFYAWPASSGGRPTGETRQACRLGRNCPSARAAVLSDESTRWSTYGAALLDEPSGRPVRVVMSEMTVKGEM
jgi:hypothetical protein